MSSSVTDAQGGLETVVVTGLSGAGRSTAAKCFEDLGYYVVDNLPAELIATLVDLGSRTHGQVTKLAVVLDVRSRAFSSDLRGVIRSLDESGMRPRVLFLEASRSGAGAAVRERPPRAPVAGRRTAHRRHRCRTRTAPPAARRGRSGARHQRPLGARPASRDRGRLRAGTLDGAPELRATVVSFGFKYGLPVDADLVVDVRFLPNPYWIPELRDQTGQDAEVRDYVLGQQDAERSSTVTPESSRSSAPATGARASATSPWPSAAPAASTARS